MGDVNLDNIKANLTLTSLGQDFGLNTLAQTLGSGVHAEVGLGLDGAVNLALGNIHADLGLSNVGVKLAGGVEAKAGVDAELNGSVDLGLEDIRVKELPQIKLELAWKAMRVRLPMSYDIKLKLFGFKLFEFSLCGETQLITEDTPAAAANENVTTRRSYPPAARVAAGSTERA